MITVKDVCEYRMSALKALCHLIVNVFHHHDYYSYEVTASDTEVRVKRTSVFLDVNEVVMSGDADEMQKIVLAARIIGNKTTKEKRNYNEADWFALRVETLLRVLNITEYEWRCSGLKLHYSDLPLMLEFAAKFPEMRFGDAVETGRRFYAALDERLLDLCTDPNLEGLVVSEEAYRIWEYTQRLSHLRTTRIVTDAVAWAFNNGFHAEHTTESYGRVLDLLDLPRPDDSAWASK